MEMAWLLLAGQFGTPVLSGDYIVRFGIDFFLENTGDLQLGQGSAAIVIFRGYHPLVGLNPFI
jgi:hypothetical protein